MRTGSGVVFGQVDVATDVQAALERIADAGHHDVEVTVRLQSVHFD